MAFNRVRKYRRAVSIALWMSASVLLAVHLIVRLIDAAQMIWYYPFATEAVTQLGQLFFLSECGFHHFCPYWYNGFTSFLVTPPGWYFFSHPFLALTHDVKSAAYLSMIVLYVLGFVLFFALGKILNLTRGQRVVFFLVFFGNNIMIKLINNVRGHELMAWVLFVAIVFVTLFYKDRALRASFYLVIPLVALVFVTHQSVGVLAGLFVAGLFLAKPVREKVKIALSVLVALLLAAFWMIPAAFEASRNLGGGYLAVETWWLFEKVHFTSVAVFLLPLLAFFTFGLYYKKTVHKRTTAWYFAPALLIALLFMTGVLRFVPVFQHVFTYMYFSFLYFLIALFVLPKMNTRTVTLNLVYAVFALAVVAISLVGTPFFQKPGFVEHAIVDLSENIDRNYMFVGPFPSSSLPSAYYGYFAIYTGKSSLLGWVPHIRDMSYNAQFHLYKKSPVDCAQFVQESTVLGIEFFYGYKETCTAFQKCGLTQRGTQADVCLYEMSRRGVKQTL